MSDWVPCSKRLPDKPNVYTVTDLNGKVVRYVFNDNESSREYWRRCAKAWMPLPAPYTARIILDHVPPEDVHPVVRCKDCEHWDDMYGTCYCEDFEVHCQDYYIGDMHTEPDFFCGFGKQKG